MYRGRWPLVCSPPKLSLQDGGRRARPAPYAESEGHGFFTRLGLKASPVRALTALCLGFVCLTLSVRGTAWAGEKRVALVVGVGAYRNAATLPNQPADAKYIAPLLRKLGFDTDLVTDPDRAALEAAVRRFNQRIDGAAATLFFYAGHGIQVGGRNYLLPVDAKVERETDLRWEALDLQAVLDGMEGANRVNLVFLDACRDNPLSRSLASKMGARSSAVGRGLAREDRAGAGTLIAYATDPGDVAADGDGANSPFTTALGKYIVTPGLEIRQIMTRVRAEVLAATGGRQRPWDNSSLAEDFYFTPPAQAQRQTPVPVPAPLPQPMQGGDPAELAFWTAVQASPDPRDVEAYLEAYPHGRFIVLARNKLDRLRREASLLAVTRTPEPSPAVNARQPDPVPSTGVTRPPAPLITPAPTPLVTPSPVPPPKPVPPASRDTTVTPVPPPPIPTRQSGASAQVAGLFDTPRPGTATPAPTVQTSPAPSPVPARTPGRTTPPVASSAGTPAGGTAVGTNPTTPAGAATTVSSGSPRPVGALLAEGFAITPRLINGSGATSGVFMPDARHVLTGGGDGTARLWDAVTGRQIRVYGADGDPAVRSVAVSPDGKFVFLGLSNGSARLLDAATGREARAFKGHEGWITAAAFSPDGKLLLTAAGDHTTRLWDAATGQQLRTFEGHRGIVTAAAVSADGKWALTGSDDRTARLWDIATGQSSRTLDGHTARVRAVAFSPDGKWILTGSDDKTARVWETASGRFQRGFEGHADHVRGVAFSPDGRLVLTGSDDKTARLWETGSGHFLRAFSGHRDGIGPVGFSGTGMVVLTVSDDATARLWDVTTGAMRQTLLPLMRRGALALNAAGLPIAVTGIENDAYYFSRGQETRWPADLRAQGYDLPVPTRTP